METADENLDLLATVRTCNLHTTSDDPSYTLETEDTEPPVECDPVACQPVPVQPEAQKFQLPITATTYQDRSTTKLMRKAMSHKYIPHTSPLRLHIDGGANISLSTTKI